MKEIQLTRGLIAFVDDEDFEVLSQYKWFATDSGYAARNVVENGKPRVKSMHRIILGLTDPKVLTDHIDGNKTNNIKSNLRPCNHSQNACNKPKPGVNMSGYKGVSWQSKTGSWSAKIKINKKDIWIGEFDSKEEAARHYNKAAAKYHGEFALMNDVVPIFPEKERRAANKSNKTGFRGVSWYRITKRWKCAIMINYKKIHIGYFDTPEEAALGFDKKARELLGDRARLNFPNRL